MENNRSMAMKRAYANGNRAKATCKICGKDIFNRMVYREDAGAEKNQYAHTSCAKKSGWKFELCW
jgi:hypothetical protein